MQFVRTSLPLTIGNSPRTGLSRAEYQAAARQARGLSLDRDDHTRRMTTMESLLRIVGFLLLGIVAATLVTLRLTGLEPAYVDPSSQAFARSGMTARPGLWLTGEVVTTPVTNWDWVNSVNDPIRKNTIMLETRTWYGIPHSVTIAIRGLGDKLYVNARQDEARMAKTFPDDKAWTANVARDPRVRMKIGGRIYEMTLVLIADRAEVAQIIGRDPEKREMGPDGTERVKEVIHCWRVFQRNVLEYGNGSAARAANVERTNRAHGE
jgi:hypothetical protein